MCLCACMLSIAVDPRVGRLLLFSWSKQVRLKLFVFESLTLLPSCRLSSTGHRKTQTDYWSGSTCCAGTIQWADCNNELCACMHNVCIHTCTRAIKLGQYFNPMICIITLHTFILLSWLSHAGFSPVDSWGKEDDQETWSGDAGMHMGKGCYMTKEKRNGASVVMFIGLVSL